MKGDPRPEFERPIHVGKPNIGDRRLFQKLVDQALDATWLTNDGPLVRALEARIEALLGVRNVVAMANGTVSLEIAARALGLHGEVIVPSYTFVATAHALNWMGITPVFADIDPTTHNLDPSAVESMITPRTTGIVGVHLWGRPAPIEDLQSIANQHGLKLMFDAAHAFQVTRRGVHIGNFGSAELFSFHATKFFNTLEGGAVATQDDELAARMRLMRNFGFSGIDRVTYSGTNAKMSEISAAMGLTNLESLQDFVNLNHRNYLLYQERLSAIPSVSLLPYDQKERNNFQYIVMQLDVGLAHRRDALVEGLHQHNVLARKYFWPGVHLFEPYRSLQPHAGLVLPRTGEVAERVVVLPTGSSVDERDINVICSLIEDLLSGERNG